MTEIEKLETKIAEMVGNDDKILHLLEILRAAIRKDTVEDVLIEIDEMQATDTAMDVSEMIRSNF